MSKGILKGVWFLLGLVVFALGAMSWLVIVSARFFWEIKLVNDYGFAHEVTSHLMQIGIGVLVAFSAFYIGEVHERFLKQPRQEDKAEEGEDVRQLHAGQKKAVGR